MIIDQIMTLGSSAMTGMMDAFPPGPTSFDTSQIRELLNGIAAWNNWLALKEFCICVGILIAVWVAKQTLAGAFKAIDTVKP